MFTSAPQSVALQRNAFPLPHSSLGKGQATSVHTGTVAVAAACRGTPNHANAAASALPSKAATTAIRVTLLIALPFASGLASCWRDTSLPPQPLAALHRHWPSAL